MPSYCFVDETDFVAAVDFIANGGVCAEASLVFCVGSRTAFLGDMCFVEDEGEMPFSDLTVVFAAEVLPEPACVCPVESAASAATLDPGTSEERAAFIRFPMFEPRLREREVLFSVTPSASRSFRAA